MFGAEVGDTRFGDGDAYDVFVVIVVLFRETDSFGGVGELFGG